MIRLPSILLAAALLAFPAVVGRAQTEAEARFPYGKPPIDYFGAETGDAVGRLARRVAAGEVALEYRDAQGYLRALLRELGVPIESQMLVFAKNSVHARLISPENPRALYFSDEVYVGYVPGAPALEISAVDPRKGAVFYTLRQERSEAPKIAREESCLLCHASVNSLLVPGHLVRSFLTDAEGSPTRGQSRISHDTPLAERWGGWYVTGQFGTQPHMGNLAMPAELLDYERHPEAPGRAVDLGRRLDAAKYPALQSDIVALLVHDHQTHLHNLLTRVRYEHEFDRKDSSEDQLLRYLLFADAAPLDSPVLGSSGFEKWFEEQGPRDRQGRSLRQFDLETRVFKYRCSYLIDSPALRSLPEPIKDRLYRRLWEALKNDSADPASAAIPASERRAIVEILRATVPGLPGYWTRE